MIVAAPRARSSWTCSSPVTPRPITAALLPSWPARPDCACTHVESTCSSAAAVAGMVGEPGAAALIRGHELGEAAVGVTARQAAVPAQVRQVAETYIAPAAEQGRVDQDARSGGTAPDGPGDSTQPAISWPRIRGRRTGVWPLAILRSVAHRPAWATRTSASPSAAGGGTSLTATRPGSSSTAARICPSGRGLSLLGRLWCNVLKAGTS